MRKKKFVLSIAGLDPCAGAGLLSDIKTFEANNTYGIGVCSAITFQNETSVGGVSWVPFSVIKNQVTPIFNAYKINYVKIGLIENAKMLTKLIQLLKNLNTEIKIIWDPIFKSSSGFEFRKEPCEEEILEVLKNIFLIIPNYDEINTFFPSRNPEDICQQLGNNNAVLLKGGHKPGEIARDILFYKEGVRTFESIKLKTEKHGTGCVLSSAITASLAKGHPLEKACQKGKNYINSFLASTETLLGNHYQKSEKTYC